MRPQQISICMQGDSTCVGEMTSKFDGKRRDNHRHELEWSEADVVAARASILSQIMKDPVTEERKKVAFKHSLPHLGMNRTGDHSIRCTASTICDAPDHLCYPGSDGLGCTTDTSLRREHVLGAIRWAWKSYRSCAWGFDELHPISCTGHQWFGLGLYMVDALDTLILAGLDQVMPELCLVASSVSIRTSPNSRDGSMFSVFAPDFVMSVPLSTQ